MPDSHNRPTRGYGWVFYDGHCSMCSRWAGRFTNVLLRRRFLTAPLQRGWVQQRLKLDSKDALTEMRVLSADGELLGGAAAVVYLAGRIWWARPLAVIANLPGVMGVLSRSYRFIARRRGCAMKCGATSQALSVPTPHTVQVEPGREADRAA
ncbi:MAG: DUF393 domain-containing protein [Planctomycetes bacterium]|nr:DUF393 domain-containing protein [Planctomycetota bacterium]MCH8260333.1 DUF393 domain-containing protein [Planctomycetota bacterium]